jgi:predicted DNA-binding protein
MHRVTAFTTVRLEPATEQRLDQLAQLTGRTKAFTSGS